VIVLAVVALSLTTLARGDDLDRGPWLPVVSVQNYAGAFFTHQSDEDGYFLGPRVQRHLKAEIAMVLAAQATGQPEYAESALRDLQWVIANRLEPNGGLNWDGPQNQYFFECHQHWFLIASELIRTTMALDDSLKGMQAQVWQYLIGNNQASADFYDHNAQHYGPFFAYRSVDRLGWFQTQAPFKGSYEVGAALWSLAMHQQSSWLDGPRLRGDGLVGFRPLSTYSVANHLDAMVSQVSLSSQSLGFVDPSQPLWVRSLLWNGHGWDGWEPHDWKYSLHMQEGALLYQILTGDHFLDGTTRTEAENLIASVMLNGSIPSIPDPFGSPAYEYGEALSALALAATAFRDSDPDLAGRSILAGQRAARYVVENFTPSCEEDGALLLAGLARIYQAQVADTTQTSGIGDLSDRLNATSLEVWPNPAREGISIRYRMPPGTEGVVRIIDASGRERMRLPLPAAGDADGTHAWEGADAEFKQLPSGRYSAVLEAGSQRRATGLVILR
jgi:hypothetical protein